MHDVIFTTGEEDGVTVTETEDGVNVAVAGPPFDYPYAGRLTRTQVVALVDVLSRLVER